MNDIMDLLAQQQTNNEFHKFRASPSRSSADPSGNRSCKDARPDLCMATWRTTRRRTSRLTRRWSGGCRSSSSRRARRAYGHSTWSSLRSSHPHRRPTGSLSTRRPRVPTPVYACTARQTGQLRLHPGSGRGRYLRMGVEIVVQMGLLARGAHRTRRGGVISSRYWPPVWGCDM